MPKCRTVTLEQGTTHQKHWNPFSDNTRELNESQANIQNFYPHFETLDQKNSWFLKIDTFHVEMAVLKMTN